MSMWCLPPPPTIPTPSVIPVVWEGFWDVLVPSLPWPGQACGGQLQGLGKTQIAKTQKWPPVPSGRLGVLTPLPSLSQWAVPRAHGPKREPSADKASGRALLVPPGLQAWSRVPGPSVFIASICAVLWARWPAASAPRLGATIPSRPSLDPARTTVGPSLHRWSRPLCPHPTRPHPPRSGPGLECTGACPCFSFSDREINFPLRSQGVCCCLLVRKGKWGPHCSASLGHPWEGRGPGAVAAVWLVEEEGFRALTQMHQPTRPVLSWLGGFCRGKAGDSWGLDPVGHPVSRVTPACHLWALLEPLGGNGFNLKKGEPC